MRSLKRDLFRRSLARPTIVARAIATMLIVSAASPEDPLSGLGPDLARARAQFHAAGKQLWPGYGNAPSGMLLIAKERETLICQDDPPADFKPLGRDPATRCLMLDRARSGLPDNLLAAMPIFGLKSTMVMGTPEATGMQRVDWLRTILHEHFHQWQTSRPGYLARVSALDLKGGDETGMWMLNFPFPYADPSVDAAYARASRLLADALATRGSAAFLPAFDRYLAARDEFAGSAGARNWRYLEFELWQEGGARWTEYAIAKSSRDPGMRASAMAGEQRVLYALMSPDLKRQGRELAYVYGAAELMLIDACGPRWRLDYPTETALGPLLKRARKSCRQPD